MEKTLDNTKIIDEVAAEVRRRLEGEGSGHDWWHVHRVRNLAKRLAAEEGADPYVAELAALLHDIADWKFHGGDDTAGPNASRQVLEGLGADAATVAHVCDIVATISFKGAGVSIPMKTLEGKVVQDADRLEALGAIGIARAFAYGGYKQRQMHVPGLAPVMHATAEEYKKSEGTTINHFHEKLLLLKDRMNTSAGRRLAEERHRFMEDYLARFDREWEGAS
ncbi:MAG TPA: HD domain-containing protein [Candidatus Eisenbacteria bacterium]|nr:HD domain-containing protein [Candidatus Eisenbacteria bacterium]